MFFFSLHELEHCWTDATVTLLLHLIVGILMIGNSQLLAKISLSNIG